MHTFHHCRINVCLKLLASGEMIIQLTQVSQYYTHMLAHWAAKCLSIHVQALHQTRMLAWMAKTPTTKAIMMRVAKTDSWANWVNETLKKCAWTFSRQCMSFKARKCIEGNTKWFQLTPGANVPFCDGPGQRTNSKWNSHLFDGYNNVHTWAVSAPEWIIGFSNHYSIWSWTSYSGLCDDVINFK